jgi:glycerol-3-phosphate cytidylyltransferase
VSPAHVPAEGFPPDGVAVPDGPVVGYAPGVFDLFHVGHLNLLLRAGLMSDILIAGVVSDAVGLAMKGRQPVVPEGERRDIVACLRCVDAAYIEDVGDKLAAWQRHRFQVIFKGSDWRGTRRGDELEAAMATVGVRVCYLPYTGHTSSTLIRAARNEGGATPIRRRT